MVPISSHGVAVSGGHLEPVEAGAEGSGEGVYRSGLLFDNSNSAGAGGRRGSARPSPRPAHAGTGEPAFQCPPVEPSRETNLHFE